MVQFGLFRHRGFALLWTAGLVSMAGDWLLSIALPIYVYQLTGSPAATAGAVAARVVAGMVSAPIAGVLVDRWDRRQVMIGANLARALLLLPLAVDSIAQLWVVYVVIGVQSLLSQFVGPAEHALLPRLVPEKDLAGANGLNALNNNIARLVGPALGGVVAATMGLTGAALLDSASFLLAALLAGLIPAGAAVSVLPAGGDDTRPRGFVRRMAGELGDGLRIIRRHTVLKALFVALAVTAVGEGIMSSLFAVFVSRALHGGAAELGWLMSAQAVGGIVGGLASAAVSRRVTTRWLLIVGLLLFGLIDLVIFNYPRWFSAFGPVVWMFVLVGIPAAILLVAFMTMLQTEVPDALRGRVFSTAMLVEAAALLVGAGVAGTLTDRYGVVNVLTGQGAVYVVAGIVFALLTRSQPAQPPDPVEQSVIAEPVLTARAG